MTAPNNQPAPEGFRPVASERAELKTHDVHGTLIGTMYRIPFLGAEHYFYSEESYRRLESTIATLRAQLDAKEAEVEHRAKQRDEFQNLFIEASDGFNRRGEQLARLTAELDAVRKERDQFQERCSSEWAVAVERDAAQARCGELERAFVALLERPRPIQISAAELAQFKALLTPSQQPDNFDSSGVEANAQSREVTHPPAKREDSETRERERQSDTDGLITSGRNSESSASPAVTPSRPEPVKAGDWLPIESAPRWEDVLVAVKSSEYPEIKQAVSSQGTLGVWSFEWDRRFENGSYCEAIGWQPLPAPPIAPEGKATEGEG